MKVTFTGVPGEKHESVRMYGQDFPLNEAVDVTDPTAMRKLANHPHFKAEKSDEDRKIDEQVKRDFAAAATAGLMQAQANDLRGQQAAPQPAPAPAPVESGLRPLKSALEYQQVVEGAGVGADLRTALQPEEQNTEENTDGNAGGTRDQDPAKAEGGRHAADPQRGRAGKRS